MDVYIGQKLLCTCRSWKTPDIFLEVPVCGIVYTVRDFVLETNDRTYILLKEIVNPIDERGLEPMWTLEAFRPAWQGVTNIKFALDILQKEIQRANRFKIR